MCVCVYLRLHSMRNTPATPASTLRRVTVLAKYSHVHTRVEYLRIYSYDMRTHVGQMCVDYDIGSNSYRDTLEEDGGSALQSMQYSQFITHVMFTNTMRRMYKTSMICFSDFYVPV